METPDWYKIQEVPIQQFVKCVEPIYRVLIETSDRQPDGDPFIKTILASHSGMTLEQWAASERARMYEKRLSMVIGDFHE